MNAQQIAAVLQQAASHFYADSLPITAWADDVVADIPVRHYNDPFQNNVFEITMPDTSRAQGFGKTMSRGKAATFNKVNSFETVSLHIMNVMVNGNKVLVIA